MTVGGKLGKRCCFLSVDSQFPSGPVYHPSVALSTHSVIGDLSDIGHLPLGVADEVVPSIINQEIKKEIQ